jgi:hypothetical protein
MIVRLAFYMTLVAVFYIYCSADSSSGNFKPPNDINLIETPSNDTTFLLDDAGTRLPYLLRQFAFNVIQLSPKDFYIARAE